LKTSDFDYDLPEELIAQEPLPERSASRMMVVHRNSGVIEHATANDLPDFLVPGDLLVLNDTKVIPTRVFGCKQDAGGKVELLLLEDLGGGEWSALCKASRRPKAGSVLSLAGEKLMADVTWVGCDGEIQAQLRSEKPLLQLLQEEGLTPLPPYIKRSERSSRVSHDRDRERYQTVFARSPGAVAAPTAGLHFTEELFDRLEDLGVGRTTLTLHVGLGTFRPVKVENLEDHRMESERYTVSSTAAAAVQAIRHSGGRIVAVGSTSVRTLETMMAENRVPVPCSGRSSLFIYPPYEFKAVDAMLTNFHLPKSSLIMMVSALAGRNLIMKAYKEAIADRYRFYSYGDCMLIL